MIESKSYIPIKWRSRRWYQICVHTKWLTFFRTFIFILIASCMVILFPVSSPLSFGSSTNSSSSPKIQYTKFRDIDSLIDLCEEKKTIGCLNYLHHNQSDYLQVLSSEEQQNFQSQYCTETKKMLFHTFWDDINTLDDLLLRLHIQSYLYTQNLHCSKMIVWVLPQSANDDNKTNEKDRIYGPDVQFRTLSSFSDDLAHVGVDIASRNSTTSKAIVSDAVRFVVLEKLGGIYVDADVLLLRDFQPLYALEFGYRWSYTEEFNTAILRLLSHSNTSTIVNSIAQARKSPYGFYPTAIRSYSLPAEFKRLPCVFFDPLWLVVDGKDPVAQQVWHMPNNGSIGFKMVFKQGYDLSRRGRTLFDGAFAHHWHSLGGERKPQKGSYMDQWSEEYERELRKKHYQTGKKPRTE